MDSRAMVGVAKTDTDGRWIIPGRWRIISTIYGSTMYGIGVMPVVMPVVALVVVMALVIPLVTTTPTVIVVSAM